jgi:predicted transcriptional regulator
LTDWALLTNHARLLLAIEREPGLRVREMAERLGLSERGIALILRDLRSSGCVTSRREGRRALYTVVHDEPLRGGDVRHRTVGEFLRRFA